MFKLRQTILVALTAMSVSVNAQIRAVELTNKLQPSAQLEKGHAIDTYGEYTILGSKGDLSYGAGSGGAGLLFYNDQLIRKYNFSDKLDGLGLANSVAIDQHALVLSSPLFKFNGGTSTRGFVQVFNKTYDGTHYSVEPSFIFFDNEFGTGFGAAIAISDDWLAIGIPGKGADGAVKVYKRDPSNGNWVAQGFLTLPDFSTATYRRKTIDNIQTNDRPASFGSFLSINHSNLIVGAPGIGASYVYKLNSQNTTWNLVTHNTGTPYLDGAVAIADEYAAALSASGNKIVIYKLFYINNTPTWIPTDQEIYEQWTIYGLAIEGDKLVVGIPKAGSTGQGQAKYYQINYQQSRKINNTSFNTSDFKWVGSLYVTENNSPNQLKNHYLLGSSVAIHGETVVAGAPNAKYLNSADGAGFRGTWSQKASTTQNLRAGGAEETDQSAALIHLFPNPASDKLMIGTGKKIISAFAYSASGAKYDLLVQNEEIDITLLTPGWYVFSVTTEHGTHTQKVSVK